MVMQALILPIILVELLEFKQDLTMVGVVEEVPVLKVMVGMVVIVAIAASVQEIILELAVEEAEVVEAQLAVMAALDIFM
jgi:hypothetical protein